MKDFRFGRARHVEEADANSEDKYYNCSVKVKFKFIFKTDSLVFLYSTVQANKETITLFIILGHCIITFGVMDGY